MILDKDGNPIEEPAPHPPHRFGFFRIPDDARVKGFGAIVADNQNTHVVVKRDPPKPPTR